MIRPSTCLVSWCTPIMLPRMPVCSSVHSLHTVALHCISRPLAAEQCLDMSGHDMTSRCPNQRLLSRTFAGICPDLPQYHGDKAALSPKKSYICSHYHLEKKQPARGQRADPQLQIQRTRCWQVQPVTGWTAPNRHKENRCVACFRSMPGTCYSAAHKLDTLYTVAGAQTWAAPLWPLVPLMGFWMSPVSMMLLPFVSAPLL